MRKEQIVISFIAVAIGIVVSATAYFFYQNSKNNKLKETKVVSEIDTTPTKKPEEKSILSVDTPKDEDVVTSKTVSVSGKTVPSAIVAIQTAINDQVITPSANGSFSVTVDLDSGVNEITFTAIDEDGTQSVVRRTVTYSKEEF